MNYKLTILDTTIRSRHSQPYQRVFASPAP